jgi:hypothetical protein
MLRPHLPGDLEASFNSSGIPLRLGRVAPKLPKLHRSFLSGEITDEIHVRVAAGRSRRVDSRLVLVQSSLTSILDLGLIGAGSRGEADDMGLIPDRDPRLRAIEADRAHPSRAFSADRPSAPRGICAA